MEGTYQILLGKESVGEVRVTRQGLYYCFHCCCDLSGEVMCRLTVTCGGETHSLGVPVPEGDVFVLRARLPAKRLGEGQPVFRVVPKYKQLSGTFVPIFPEEPFRYLSRLHNAVLERRGEQLGILLEDPVIYPTEGSPDNGQSP